MVRGEQHGLERRGERGGCIDRDWRVEKEKQPRKQLLVDGGVQVVYWLWHGWHLSGWVQCWPSVWFGGWATLKWLGQRDWAAASGGGGVRNSALGGATGGPADFGTHSAR
jgi:hypothetical protein